MHAVLAAAIANPRFARPYGSDRGEWGFEAGISGVDNFFKMNSCFGTTDYSSSESPRRTIASGRAAPIGTHGLH